MIDVSIIIPTYNRLWALPKAVDSCFASGKSIEVIVIDDGSTDGTWEWLQSRPDITSLRQDNWGKDWAVGAGLTVAKGEFVRFLDSDDWLAADSTAEQAELARQTDADIVVAGYQDFHEDGNRVETHPWVECDDFVAQQFGEVPFSHYSAFLFRRSFVESVPHRQEFALRDDRMFMLETAIRKPKLAAYPKPAFIHRHHRKGRLQLHRGFRRRFAHWTTIQVYRKAVALLEGRGELTDRRRRAAAAYIWPVVRTLARTELDEATIAANWVFELDPTFVPSERGIILSAYKFLGFRTTERLIRLLTAFRKPPPIWPPE